MKKIIVTPAEAGTSLIKLLNKHLKDAGNGFLYKMLRKKNITLNDKKATGKEKLKEKDVVTLYLSDETYNKFAGEHTHTELSGEYAKIVALSEKHAYEKLPVLWENEDMVFFNKPVNMLSQKAKKDDISANELFLAYLHSKGLLSEERFCTFKPSVCNRLDRNTSGILACGKTMKGLQELSAALKTRSVSKFYVCLVAGNVVQSMRASGYLIKDEKSNRVEVFDEELPGAVRIETAYEPIFYGEFRDKEGRKIPITMLRIHLITGKSHQIRAHLSYLGYPILGDAKYGNHLINTVIKKRFGVSSQLLHACEMYFEDGTRIFAPIPQIFDKIKGACQS